MIIINKEKFKEKQNKEADIFLENFRGGKTAQSVEKLAGVIARRAGLSVVSVSPVPDFFANKKGSFIGFFIYFSNKLLIRFNMMQRGGSSDFYSVDILDKKRIEPIETLDLRGNNVVEVVDFVSDFITGEYINYQESSKFFKSKLLVEAMTYPECLRTWLSEGGVRDRIDTILKRSRKSDVNQGLEEIRPEFEAYRERMQVRKSTNEVSAFRYTLNNVIKSLGGDVRNLAVAEVVPAEPETITSRGGKAEQAYLNLVRNEHFIKFKALRLYCYQIKAGHKDFKSLYVYGMGGIGKSHWVREILKPLPQTTYISGKISGYTGLIQILYENRDGRILVLDDTITDNDMKNQTIENILKAILDPTPPRIVSIIKANRRSESYYKDGVFHLNEEDYAEFSEYKRSVMALREDMDMIDISMPVDTPSQFAYDSSTVFLTNYRGIPQPVKDRCWILKMVFSNKQVIELIETSLKESVPEAEFPVIEEVFEEVDVKTITNEDVIKMMKEGEGANLLSREMSFRIFHRLVAIRSLGLVDKDLERALMWIELGN